jgi:hypothetical protein
MKIIPVSFIRWVNLISLVYPYNESGMSINEIGFHHKKEWHSEKCYNMDEPWKYAECKKARLKGQNTICAC